jgi:hypothetical protein
MILEFGFLDQEPGILEDGGIRPVVKMQVSLDDRVDVLSLESKFGQSFRQRLNMPVAEGAMPDEVLDRHAGIHQYISVRSLNEKGRIGMGNGPAEIAAEQPGIEAERAEHQWNRPDNKRFHLKAPLPQPSAIIVSLRGTGVHFAMGNKTANKLVSPINLLLNQSYRPVQYHDLPCGVRPVRWTLIVVES